MGRRTKSPRSGAGIAYPKAELPTVMKKQDAHTEGLQASLPTLRKYPLHVAQHPEFGSLKASDYRSSTFEDVGTDDGQYYCRRSPVAAIIRYLRYLCITIARRPLTK